MSGLRKEGFHGFPINEVHEFVDVTAPVGQEIGVIGVLIDIQSENGGDTPDGIGVLCVADVVKEFFGAMIVTGPGPATCCNSGRLQVLLIIIKRTKVLIDLFEDPVGRLAVAPKDGEVEFVVF